MPRTPDVPNTAQMLQVARLFYIDDLTKQHIADRLKIDARKVTSLLKQARQTGVVKITLQGAAESELENRLRDKFRHLIRVMIVPGPRITEKTYPAILTHWGLMAANYFEELVQNHRSGKLDRMLHVGVSGGETLLEFVNAVPVRKRENVYVHATALVGHGRLHKSASHITPNVNAAVLWTACGRFLDRCEYATVLPLPVDLKQEEGPEYLKQLAAIKPINDVLKGMSQIEVAFAYCGMVNPDKRNPMLRNKLTTTGLLQPIVSQEELTRQGALVDFSYCLLDKDCNGDPKWQFFLTAGYDVEHQEHGGIAFYKRMVATGKKVVVMAGPFKIPALKAALRGKIFNVLITDQHSAEQLVKSPA